MISEAREDVLIIIKTVKTISMMKKLKHQLCKIDRGHRW